MLLRPTANRQERDRKGGKSQENIRKKDMKAIQPEPIQHFVPHPQQSKWSRTELQEWHNISTLCLTGNQKVSEWIANSALCASSGNQEIGNQEGKYMG